MSTPTATMPTWQRGYDLARLRAVRQIFREHDGGLPLGAFTAVKETHVAEWLAGQELKSTPGNGMVVARQLHRPQPVTGWNGDVVVRLEPGDVHVRRMAWRDEAAMLEVGDYLVALAEVLEPGKVLLIEAWVEHPEQQRLLRILGAVQVGTKIRASSELFGLYLLSGEPLQREVQATEQAEVRALGTLGLHPVSIRGVYEELQAAGLGWADHYSSYNQRHSWSALALQGYTPPGAEPDAQRIEKPAEMSRKWRAEHPDWQQWTLEQTPLAWALPLTSDLLNTLPGRVSAHRVRLMRLTPGGGELTRHSDITDPDVGTRDGQYMRVHLPLVTNPRVLFQQWLLDGRQVGMHMPLGQWCYIDTRKPHTARNGGDVDRVHLVADVAATPELRQALLEGRQALPL